jgi:deazaflavin-dependent oxidoreductase (nitroreductase family)
VSDTAPNPVRGRSERDEARAEVIRRAAIEHAPKHARLIRSQKHGQLLSASMAWLFLLRPPGGYGLLTTTGARSGKRRRKCVRMVREADKVYLVQLRPPAIALQRPLAVCDWVWNIRADPRVTVRIRGGTFAGAAREITDPAERERARAAFLDRVYPFDWGECDVHLRGLPSRAKIEDLHRYWFDTGIPLAVDLDS